MPAEYNLCTDGIGQGSRRAPCETTGNTFFDSRLYPPWIKSTWKIIGVEPTPLNSPLDQINNGLRRARYYAFYGGESRAARLVAGMTWLSVVAPGPACFVQSIVGRKCIVRLPGLYLEQDGDHGGDIVRFARAIAELRRSGVEPPWLPGSVPGLSLLGLRLGFIFS